MTEKKEQHPPIPIRNIEPGIYRQALAAAVLISQSVGQWISQAIKERIDKEKGG